MSSPEISSLDSASQPSLPPRSPTVTSTAYDARINESRINVTQQFEGDGDIFYFYLWTYVIPAIFGLIIVVGTAGNSLVIYCIVSRKSMRTVTNLLLLNLAVSDIAFLLIVVPFTAYKYAASTWPFGDLVCKFIKYLLYVTSYVTVYTLVAVSALRFLTVVCSVSTAAYRTKTNVVILIVALWVVMFIVNIPALLVHRTKQYYDYAYCGVKEGCTEPLFLTFFIFAYVLPLFVICLLYLLILLHLRRARSASLVDSSERTARAFKVIVLVVVVFGLSWLPSHVNSLVAMYGTLPAARSYMVLRIVWHCMAYGNSCANPFIYNFMSRDFRKCFSEVIFCGRRRGKKRGPSSRSSTSTRRNRSGLGRYTESEKKTMV